VRPKDSWTGLICCIRQHYHR